MTIGAEEYRVIMRVAKRIFAILEPRRSWPLYPNIAQQRMLARYEEAARAAIEESQRPIQSPNPDPQDDRLTGRWYKT